MVDLCPVVKWYGGLKTGLKKACFWSKISGIWMVLQVMWLYHLNTRHPYCSVFRCLLYCKLLQNVPNASLRCQYKKEKNYFLGVGALSIVDILTTRAVFIDVGLLTTGTRFIIVVALVAVVVVVVVALVVVVLVLWKVRFRLNRAVRCWLKILEESF